MDIKVNKRKQVSEGQEREVKYYDIYHENPFVSSTFKKDLIELKELAITDLLTIPVEQAHLQLERLKNLEELFHTFWHKYYHLNIPTGSEHNLELVLRLNLDDLFIAPGLMFFDHAIADDNFINDLESTIKYREKILQDFKTAVLKIVKRNKEPTNIPGVSSSEKEIKAKPSFRQDIIADLLDFLKNYFSDNDKDHLFNLLKSADSTSEPLVFMGNGNQLADAFKQLFDANLIAGCNKAELHNWIMTHFVTVKKEYKRPSQKSICRISFRQTPRPASHLCLT